ncbi:MAG: C25 family cysteine peptidase [Thermoplasmatota archaeon]
MVNRSTLAALVLWALLVTPAPPLLGESAASADLAEPSLPQGGLPPLSPPATPISPRPSPSAPAPGPAPPAQSASPAPGQSALSHAAPLLSSSLEGGARARATGSIIYAILCPSAFKEELVPLRDWKTKKGMSAEIFTLEEMLAAYSGDPGAPPFARVHQYLRNLYRSNPELMWVLIVGDGDADAETFPVPYIFTNASHDQRMGDPSILDYVPSDVMYSGLSHDWNADGDELYGESGEEDWAPEVYVGRWPCKSEAEVTWNVNKLLNYERSPPVGDWMRSALFAGALYDIPNIINPDPNQWTENMYEWTHDNGRTPILQTMAQFPPHMTKTALFDYNETYGGQYTKQNDTLDELSFPAQMNAGHSIVVTASHGWISGNGVNHYFGNGSDPQLPVYQKFRSFYYWTDARDASNGARLPLMYSSGCDVANFTTFWHYDVGENRDRTFEQLLKKSDGGAIGFVSATNGDYWNNVDGNWWLEVSFWRIFFNGSYRPGEALYRSKVEYDSFLRSQSINTGLPRYRQNKAVYCLLGDPEVPIWTDLPSTLSVTVDSPAELFTIPQTVNVTVRDAATTAPVGGALVALTAPGTFARGLTDASGKASLMVDPADPGQVNLTATAHNFLPFETALPVSLAPAELRISPQDIRVTSSGPVIGEGEEVTISANISNVGRLPAESVLVKFWDGEPGTGPEIGSAIIPQIPARESRATEVVWRAVGGSHKIYVQVDPQNAISEFDESNNIAFIEVLATNLDLTLSPEDITFEPSVVLRGERTAANGTTLSINVTVRNLGAGDAEGVYVRLFDGYPEGGTRIEGDKRIEAIAGGGSGSAAFSWSETSAGPHTITAVVDPMGRLLETDEGNNVASAPIRIDVPPAFFRPIDPVFIDEDRGQGTAFDLQEFVSDPDTAPADLAFRLVGLTRAEANVSVSPSGMVGYRPLPDWNGAATATVSVSDGVSEATAEFLLTVRPVNDPPRIEPIPDVELMEGEYCHRVVNASDVDVGDILTFSDDTPLFDINSTTGRVSFTPSRASVGRHVVRVTVTDIEGLSDFFVWRINVTKRNMPPQLQLGGGVVIQGREGRPIYFRFNATDPDGDALTFSDDSPLFDLSPSTGELNFTPPRGSAGNYSFNVTVRDGGGLTDTRAVGLEILPEPVVATDGGAVLPPWVPLALGIGALLAVAGGAGAIFARRRALRALESVERERYESIYGEGSFVQAGPALPSYPAREPTEQERARAEGAGGGPKCSRCGSRSVQVFEDGGAICNRCGQVVTSPRVKSGGAP